MGLSVSQGHLGGLIQEHGLIRGHGLIRRHQVVLLKSTKEVRSTFLKATVQTKQQMIVLKCTKKTHHVLHTCT